MIELWMPWALAALPLPWLVHRILPSAKEQGAALRVPFYRSLAGADAGGGPAGWHGHVSVALKALAWGLVVFAAAQPRWLGPLREVPTSGRDLMLALDLSGSMRTPDFEVRGQAIDRFSVVRAVAREFTLARKGDRVGLVLFGTRAFLQAPLTSDLPTVAQLLDESEVGLAGEETAIGDALGLAVKHLRQRPEGERVLVLLSDGESNAGVIDPKKATALARDAGVRVYTIGVGTGAQAIATPFGVRAGPGARGGADQETLREIAEQTGGKHFRADDTESLVAVYREIDALEPTLGDPATVRSVRALFAWPLGAALALAGCLGLGSAAGEAASLVGQRMPAGSAEAGRPRRSLA
jgi:Ca-activated chloride channel family protein